MGSVKNMLGNEEEGERKGGSGRIENGEIAPVTLHFIMLQNLVSLQ